MNASLNMVMKSLLFNIFLLGILSAYPALANRALTEINYKDAIDFKGIYQFAFSGLVFGKMGIEYEQTARHYDLTADVALTGLIKLFVTHTSHTTVDADGRNITYETHYHTKKKPRYVKLVYNNGALTEEKALPPEDPKQRPTASAKLKNAAVDPLSFIVRMRRKLAEAFKIPLPLREGAGGGVLSISAGASSYPHPDPPSQGGGSFFHQRL